MKSLSLREVTTFAAANRPWMMLHHTQPPTSTAGVQARTAQKGAQGLVRTAALMETSYRWCGGLISQAEVHLAIFDYPVGRPPEPRAAVKHSAGLRPQRFAARSQRAGFSL